MNMQSIIVILLIISLVAAFFFLLPQILLKYYQARADMIIRRVENGELEYLQSSKDFVSSGKLGTWGYIALASHPVRDTSVRFTLYAGPYRCTKSSSGKAWHCVKEGAEE